MLQGIGVEDYSIIETLNYFRDSNTSLAEMQPTLKIICLIFCRDGGYGVNYRCLTCVNQFVLCHLINRTFFYLGKGKKRRKKGMNSVDSLFL